MPAAQRVTQSKKILQTALDRISSKGYANTSMRDIADEAGVALSQLNYHYKNKEGLFMEAIDMTIQTYMKELEAHVMTGNTPKERWQSFIGYFRKMLLDNPKLFKVLFDFVSMALWSSAYGDKLNSFFRDIATLIEKNILLDNHLKNKIKKYNTNAIAQMLSSALLGASVQFLLNPSEMKLLNALDAIDLIYE
jgi:AcrR family transcriptional regulator